MPLLSVLDPAGMWTYDVDLENPRIKTISKFKEPIKDGERKSDDELIVMSPEESTLFGMDLEISSRQREFYQNSQGLNPKNLEELKNWYKEKYGVTLKFTPHKN